MPSPKPKDQSRNRLAVGHEPQARISLGNFPTRLSQASSLGAELGVDLWLKHEFEADGFGAGNKVRKLEYLIPEILCSGYHGLVVDGTTQSNCAMALALYAPRFGLAVDLVLYGDTAPVGNFADIARSGANLAILPEWSPHAIREAEESLVAQAKHKQRRLYVVPTGATNSVTVQGGIDLAREVAQQESHLGFAFDYVIFPTASGGTQAGLEIGRAMLRRGWHLIGIGVANDEAFFQKVTQDAAASPNLSALTDGITESLAIRTHMGAIGPRYGLPLPHTFEEIGRLRREHGLVLDSVYTYKTFVGLQQLLAIGEVRKGSRVLFIHTGGTNERFVPDPRQSLPT